MTTIKQTTINTARIELTERDQYNDYSVVCDYHVHVNDPDHGYFRQFFVGTNKAKAFAAYDLAASNVRRTLTAA